MRQKLRACTIAFALLGGAGLAAAQSNIGPAGAPGAPGAAQGQLHLNPSQGRAVILGLKDAQPQAPTADVQAQGSKVPDSMTTQPMPDNVTADVPQVKSYLFVKLPDRVLIIDPDSKTVAEMVLDTSPTSGSGASGGGSDSTK
jgi:hypothetical protein